MNFKVGDKVVCIRPPHGALKENKTYTVQIDGSGHYNGTWIYLEEVMGWNDPSNFVLESVYKSKLFNVLK